MSRWFPKHVVVAPVDEPGSAWPAESAFESFERALDEHALTAGTRITVVVGGDAMRLRIIPWRNELANDAERRAFAAHCFQDAYGDAARDWSVRLDAPRYGRATLAAAIDALLPDRLEAAARARRLRVVGIRPALMQAFNYRRREIGRDLCWFVWMERHWTTAFLVSPQAPLHVKRLPAPHADLSTVLAREWFGLGMDGPPCPAYVDRSPAASSHGPVSEQADARAQTSWPLVYLPLDGRTATPPPSVATS